MVRVGVLGATGYTGYETIKLLARHPEMELAFATARSDAGKRLSQLYATPLDITLKHVDEVELGSADLLFLCLPHGAAQAYAAAGLAAGCRVVDLSADFRLRDAARFQQWYKDEHKHPELLAEAVYGLTEWRREEIRRARLVANPGCYPTSILLALAPLLRAGLVSQATPIIADSKSGVSGAGRSAKVGSLFAEVSENFKPYNIGHSHRHVAEIEQELGWLSQGSVNRVLFSPHLLPVIRGILSTIYLPLPAGWSASQLHGLYSEAYADQPFVWLLPPGETASLAHVTHTNRCALSLHPVPELQQLIIVSTIDNLIKGASGQAIQNANVMFGLAETMGLV
jgi:N-acetyl-gamma-glutamyl-phosphate reductase